jgi:phosphatidylinositol alpha-1,6-mannosyltransferase
MAGSAALAVTRKPRVLLLTPDYPPARGGIQYLLHGLVRHARQVDYHVVTFGDTPEAETAAAGGTVRVRRRTSPAAAIARLNFAALAAARAWRPDVVLSGHIVMAPAGRLTGMPFVQYLHASEIPLRPRLAAFAVRHATAVIAVSGHTRSLALAAGASPSKVHVIPPGIDVPQRPPTTPRERAPMIVTVARLEDRYKGFEVLVRALPLVRSRVHDATLTLVGTGHLGSSLEALAEANGCGGALRRTGGVTDAQRDEVLAAATVFAMPSRLPAGSGGEGFGIAYLEAGARGTPVVAGNVGGALDAVVDGETGILVRPEDHIAVAEAISVLLLDRDLATRLGDAGRKRAESLTWPIVVREVEDVLLAAARGAGSTA